MRVACCDGHAAQCFSGYFEGPALLPLVSPRRNLAAASTASPAASSPAAASPRRGRATLKPGGKGLADFEEHVALRFQSGKHPAEDDASCVCTPCYRCVADPPVPIQWAIERAHLAQPSFRNLSRLRGQSCFAELDEYDAVEPSGPAAAALARARPALRGAPRAAASPLWASLSPDVAFSLMGRHPQPSLERPEGACSVMPRASASRASGGCPRAARPVTMPWRNP